MTDQPTIHRLTLTLGSVSGPSDIVPAQIRPGRSCARTCCANNVDSVCKADPSQGPRGKWAPFLPLCPEPDDNRASVSLGYRCTMDADGALGDIELEHVAVDRGVTFEVKP